MRSKRGLSTVVTTLIIVLLVLVAIGIIWAVIRGIIESGTGQIDVRSKCIEVDVRATAATYTAPVADDLLTTTIDETVIGGYTVTLYRGAGGDDIEGVKLVFYDSTGDSSDVIPVSGNIVPLTSKTWGPSSITGLTGTANKVKVTVYFKNEAGVEQLCGTSSEFSF